VVPAAVQIEALHTHLPFPLVVTQDWFGPQTTGLPHWPPVPHVSKPDAVHWVAPGVQASQTPFRQTGSAPPHGVDDAL
jgi:hypothetical protein